MKTIKSKEGFTLLESLLVLLCIGVFFTVPLIAIKNWQEKAEIEHFFTQLERNIQKTHQSAIVDGKTTAITQSKKKKRLVFEYFYHWEKYPVEFPMLDSLELMSDELIEFSGVTGNIKEINGIKIRDTVNKRIVTYSFQLGSGKVIRSEKKF